MPGRKPFLFTLAASLLLAIWLVCALGTDAWAVTLYSVRPKDTLARIARGQGLTVAQILRANPDLHRNMDLKIGQIIVIPDRDELLARDDEDETTTPSLEAKSAAPVPHPVVENAPAALPPAVVAPAPAPTPLADARASGAARFENVAVVSRAALSGPDPHHFTHRSMLASRRGRLLLRITTMARRFMGVPYVWGGTSSRGYDCSGFTMRIYKMAGIQLKRLADEQYYQGTPTLHPMPGDLVFFHTYLPGPSHVGIYLGDNYFIHASSSRGVTISSLSDPYFKRRYLGARRFF